MIVTARINARSAARALEASGYKVLLPANLDQPPPRRVTCHAIVDDEEAAEQLDWAYGDEPELPSVDAAAIGELIAACIIGDLQLARHLVNRAFDSEADREAVDRAILECRRMAA